MFAHLARSSGTSAVRLLLDGRPETQNGDNRRCPPQLTLAGGREASDDGGRHPRAAEAGPPQEGHPRWVWARPRQTSGSGTPARSAAMRM
jgi:hypothetical protein